MAARAPQSRGIRTVYHSRRRVGATFPDSIVIPNVRDVPDAETARTTCLPGASATWASGVSPNFFPSM